MGADGFRGGYYHHPGLPFGEDDFYFSDPANDITVLAKAAFYNLKELLPDDRSEQEVRIPALIAELFLREGPDFVRKINGDFAIFIWRQHRGEAYLFRDHIGIAPVAWASDGERYYFSSDIISLAKAISGGEAADTEYLLAYFKYIDYRKTPSVKVKKLLPGHYLHFSGGKATSVRYWFPEKVRTDRRLDFETVAEDMRRLVRDAVAIRCDRRFTASAHVSGGLDSGIVAALARREYASQQRFYGFSWSPEGYKNDSLSYDERELVRKSCAPEGIVPVFNDMKTDDLYKYLGRYYENQGYFFEERVTYLAAERGVNLIFSGWGGDEFVSTGDRGIDMDLLKELRLRTFFSRNPVKPLRRFVHWQLFYIICPMLGITVRSVRRSFRKETVYLRKEFKKGDRRTVADYYYHRSRRQMHLRLLDFYHLQERCESWAVNGYSKGIEYRYPLLDRRIIEYMLRVPSAALCRNDEFRPLLREVGRGILSEDVRLQTLKTDPFCWGYMNEMSKELSEKITDEAEEWKKSSSMAFVDFERLENDICHYRQAPESVDLKMFSRGLIYLKGIYDFTKKFNG